jgi:hypothetical protein
MISFLPAYSPLSFGLQAVFSWSEDKGRGEVMTVDTGVREKGTESIGLLGILSQRVLRFPARVAPGRTILIQYNTQSFECHPNPNQYLDSASTGPA